MKKDEPIVIAVDFDGTVVTHEFPEIGRDIGAVPVLKKLIERGHKLILWTMRSGRHLDVAIDWFAKNEIELYGIQINPTQTSWTSSRKAHANIYVDDAALGCPLKVDPAHARPYVDWKVVEMYLQNEGLI
jgi:hypothetical protein